MQADGSCLSFLPVRVRMPRVTQGSDPALSWGAAPFPRDANIPQGAKPGKKKIPRGRLCVPDPAQTVFGVLGEAQFCLPRGSAGIYTPKPPLDAKWPRSTGPGRAGLSAGAALAPQAPSPSGFSVPAAGFTALDAGAAPGWAVERGCAGVRAQERGQRAPGRAGAAAEPQGTAGQRLLGVLGPRGDPGRGEQRLGCAGVRKSRREFPSLPPRKGRDGHAETPSPGRLHPKAWHCPLSAREPPCLPIPGFSSLGMRDSSSRAPSGPCWVFVHLPRRPGVLFPFSSPRHAPELV